MADLSKTIEGTQLKATPRPALLELPLGAIRPTGWLHDQLRLQATGLTGRLEEIWPDVGPTSAWLGGDGEDWERGPYYVDGMLPLAHLLRDETLLVRAKTWVEALLASQCEDGQFGPATNDDWWPRMVACKVLVQHADATDDPRVLPFLERYLTYQAQELPRRPLRSWGQVRGADAVLTILWVHARTGSSALIDLARLVLAQTADWHEHLTTGLSPDPTHTFAHLNHGPNVAMGLKTTAVASLVDPDPDAADRTARELNHLDALHGLVHGVFSGDEWIGGRDPHHGVETCQVVEYMYSMEQLVRIYGDGSYADRLELAAYNLLPASFDAQMLAHQYHQQANQIRISVEQRDWTYSGDDANIFGLEPHFGCCTANFHQGWPKFVRSLWFGTHDGGLASVSYAPCTVTTGQVQLEVRSSYPFTETVEIEVTAGGGRFPLRLRIPAWATDPTLTVVGRAHPVEVDDRGYVTVMRTWSPGDVLSLVLPAHVSTVPRDRGAVGLRLGPLVLANRLGEVWHDVPGAPGVGEWTVTPRRSWNFGLWLEHIDRWTVTRQPVGPVPFELSAAPVTVIAPGSRIAVWREDLGSAGPLPTSPVPSTQPLEDLTLVPYGSARLRIAEFPTLHPAFDPDAKH